MQAYVIMVKDVRRPDRTEFITRRSEIWGRWSEAKTIADAMLFSTEEKAAEVIQWLEAKNAEYNVSHPPRYTRNYVYTIESVTVSLDS